MEQLACFLVAEGVLVWYGIAAAQKHWFNFLPAIIGLVVACAGILAQFVIEGKIVEGVPGWVCYAVMVAGWLQLL